MSEDDKILKFPEDKIVRKQPSQSQPKTPTLDADIHDQYTEDQIKEYLDGVINSYMKGLAGHMQVNGFPIKTDTARRLSYIGYCIQSVLWKSVEMDHPHIDVIDEWTDAFFDGSGSGSQ